MAIKLDDFLSKKKEAAPILDLSKSTANSKEELKKLLEKIPEYKIRPEKIKPEDIKITEKNFNFKTPKRELKQKREYQFADPVPPEMRGVRLEDLSSVNIPWKMLTTLRPKTKSDDDFFSRLIELGKLRIQTEEREKKIPDSEFIRKMKSRSGVIETRIVSCTNCGEEFCMGDLCQEFMYDACVREDPSLQAGGSGAGDNAERGRTKKRKAKKKVKMYRNIPGIPKDRPTSRGRSKEKKKGRKSPSKDRKKSKSKERKKSKSRERKESKSAERNKKVKKKKKKKKKVEKVEKSSDDDDD